MKHSWLALSTLGLTLAACSGSGFDSTGSSKLRIEIACSANDDCPTAFQCKVEKEHGVSSTFCESQEPASTDDGKTGATCPAGFELEDEHGTLFCKPHGGDGGSGGKSSDDGSGGKSSDDGSGGKAAGSDDSSGGKTAGSDDSSGGKTAGSDDSSGGKTAGSDDSAEGGSSGSSSDDGSSDDSDPSGHGNGESSTGGSGNSGSGSSDDQGKGGDEHKSGS